MKKIIRYTSVILVFCMLTLIASCDLGGSGSGAKPHEHNYEKVTNIEPTCENDGGTKFECACGDFYIENVVPALGHNFGDWVVKIEPTIESTGQQQRVCDRCNYVEEQTIPKLDHEHSYMETVYNPDCENGGYTYFECSCGHSYVGNEVDPLGHTEAVREGVEPTCEYGGYTDEIYCSVCDEILVPLELLPSLGCDFSIIEVKTEATCDTNRVEIHRCSHEGCEYYQEIEIEDSALGHKFVDGVCDNCGCDEFSLGLVYENNGDGYVITSLGTCTDKHVILPETYRGKPVISICVYDFDGVEKITISESIKTIERISSDTLKEVIIPEGIETLYTNAFARNSELTTVVLPTTLKIIGSSAFEDCEKLVNINLSNVEQINSDAFNGCIALVSVDLSSLTILDRAAFNYCSGLESVNIPGTVKVIGSQAFYACTGLKELKLNEGLEKIDLSAFTDCDNLTIVEIPASVVEIGYCAFNCCDKLQTVKFSAEEGMLEKVDGSFKDNPSLTEIYMPNTLASHVTWDGKVFEKCENIEALYFPTPNFVKFAYYEFTSPESNPITFGDIKINALNPTSGEYEEIEYIDLSNEYYFYVRSYAFMNCEYPIKNLDNVYYVEKYAFSGALGLTEATLKNCIFVDSFAFENCVNLEKVTLLDSVRSDSSAIAPKAFYGCTKLTSLDLSNYDSIAEGALAGISNLESIVIPFVGEKMPTDDTFPKYPLGYIFGTEELENTTPVRQEYVRFSAGTINHEYYQFPKSLKSVEISKQKKIYYGALSGLELDTFIINREVTEFEANYQKNGSIMNFVYQGTPEEWLNVEIHSKTGYNFYHEGYGERMLLESLVLPENANIKWCSFQGVNSLRTLYILNDSYCSNELAFADCRNLYEIYYEGSNDYYVAGNVYSFGGAFANAKVVHKSFQDASMFFTLADGYTFAFYDDKCVLISVISDEVHVILPTGVTYDNKYWTNYEIDSHAFKNGGNLAQITIQKGTIYNPDGLFAECNNLYIIDIPTLGGKTLGNLFGCDNEDIPETLDQIILREEIDICDEAFASCENIERVIIQGELTKIGKNAFDYCESLTEVSMPDTVTDASDLFRNNYDMEKVTISLNITSIPSAYLHDMKVLRELTIPFLGSSVTDTEYSRLSYLFTYSNCSNETLETVTIDRGNILSNAFNGYKNLHTVVYNNNNEEGQIPTIEFSNATPVDNFYFNGTIEDWMKLTFTANTANPLYQGINVYIKNEQDQYYLLNDVEEILVPNELGVLNSYVFAGLTKVKKLEIEDGETEFTLKSNSLSNLGNVEEVIISDCVVLMENNVLNNTSVSKLTIPFVGNNAENPRNLYLTIGYSSRPTLTELKILGGVGLVGRMLEGYNVLESLYVPSTITDFDSQSYDGPLYNCSVKSIYFDVTLEEYLAGAYASLVTNVTSDYYNVFIKNEGEYYNVDNYETIIIPSSVTEISYKVFQYMDNLRVIYAPATLTKFSYSYGNNNAVVFAEAATQPEGWTNTSNPVIFGATAENVVCIDDVLYVLDSTNHTAILAKGLNPEDAIVVPEKITVENVDYTVTSICTFAFKNYSSTRGVVIPETVTSVGAYAFDNTNAVIYYYNISSGWDYYYWYDSTGTGLNVHQVRLDKVIEYDYISYNFLHVDEVNGFEYILVKNVNEGGYAKVSKYFGTATDVVVPGSINVEGTDYVVKSIDMFAFTDSNAEKVTISNGIQTINEYAFYDCANLNEVIFGDTVTKIGDNAFENCGGLESITIPTNIVKIGSNAFDNCVSLKEFKYDDRTTSIEISYPLFQNTLIDRLYLDSNISTVPAALFKNEYVVVYSELADPESTYYVSDTVCVYYNITSSNLVKVENAEYVLDLENKTATLSYVDKTLTTFVIPETIEISGVTYTVTVIGKSAFANSKITSISTPSTIKTIKSYAFANCSLLTNVDIHDNLETMEISSFYGCKNIKNIKLPFVGATLNDEEGIFDHIYGVLYSEYSHDLGLAYDIITITKTTYFCRYSLGNVEAKEIHLYGALTSMSSYTFTQNYYNEVDRLFIHTEVAEKEAFGWIASFMKGVILYVGDYDDTLQQYDSIYDFYSEDNYAILDGVTYQLEGTNATVIQMDSEDIIVPETINYKGTDYTVVTE